MGRINVERGEIVLTRLDSVIGSEQGKTRPAVVVQSDRGNPYSPTTIIAPITSKIIEKYPHIATFESSEAGIDKGGSVLAAHMRCVDRTRIVKKVGKLSDEAMKRVDSALKISLDLF